jgi:hypothetical protein
MIIPLGLRRPHLSRGRLEALHASLSTVSPGEGEGEVMKHSATTGSDSLFSRQAYAKRSKPPFHHLTLILSWKERKENPHLQTERGRIGGFVPFLARTGEQDREAES